MDIGRRVYYLRKKLGLSQEEASYGIISRSHFSNIESGKSPPQEDILVLLSKKLKVPQSYLVDYTQYDNKLTHTLDTINEYLENDEIDQAKILFNNINQHYPFIKNPLQEFIYLILKLYFLIKSQKIEESINLFDDKKIMLCDEEKLPKDLKDIYFYVSGLMYYYKKDYLVSLDLFNQCLLLQKSTYRKARCFFNMALVSYQLNNKLTAITYTEKALDVYIEYSLWDKQVDTYILLGVIYWELNYYKEAENTLLIAKEIVLKHNIDSKIDKIHHNLGLIYKAQKKFNQSIKYFDICIENINAESGNQIIPTYFSLLEVLLNLRDFQKAEFILNKSKSFIENETDYFSLLVIEAKLHLQNGNQNLFERNMEMAIDYFKKSKQWYFLKRIAKDYSLYFENNLRYKKANELNKIALESSEKIITNKR